MVRSHVWSRRVMLQGTLAAGALAAGALAARRVKAGEAPLTPECRDHHAEAETLASVEGPYFKPASPERGVLVDSSSKGHRLNLRGRVLSPSCQPVARVLLDLWHADQDGLYDDTGFRYRGHVFSDAQGHFEFQTIEPAVYPGRTRHFHFKVQAPNRAVLTTQLFFPGEPRNQVDRLFRPQLLMRVTDSAELMSAQFDFVVDA